MNIRSKILNGLEKFYLFLDKIVNKSSKDPLPSAANTPASFFYDLLSKSVGESDDVQHFLSMSRQLGAAIADQSTEESKNYQIRGNAYPINRELNAGESGLGIRLAVPVAAVCTDVKSWAPPPFRERER